MILARFAVLFLACGAAAAAPVRTEHVEAELVAAQQSAEPGKPLAAALRLKMVPRWHTYWRNPGDSGEPTKLDWTLPAGYTAGPIQWPAPRRLPAGPLLNFGYEGEVLLPVEVRVPADARDSATLAARASWLVCNEEHCIPEEADLSLRIAIGAAVDSPWAQPIAAARAALPVAASPDWRFLAARTASGIQIEIRPPARVTLRDPQFFPFEQGKIHNAGAQSFDGARLEIPRAPQPVGVFNRVAGVLLGGPQALEIDVPVVGGASTPGAPGLAVALLFAFAGGLILNLMPCVLPVLSIKVLGFAAQGDARAMRAHGALYALGVLLSFWLFAGLLIGLQAAGQEIGWGFQLQSPVFVALLAALFLALALNLSGVFELRGFAFTATAKQPFATGVLAVAVASPCTVPFMGAALGYALGETAPTALAVFTALGLGMAIPYVALAWHPQWLAWVPKPGAWMVRLKQWLAVPLYATVLWLAWVFSLQVFTPPEPGGNWKPYSESALAALTSRGKPVFVDFTAAWCVTCQVNKQLVLARPAIERAFGERGVTLLRADWTRRDPEITRALAALGRKGVPVYVLYSPGREALLLPEVLTEGALLAALGNIPRKEPSS